MFTGIMMKERESRGKTGYKFLTMSPISAIRSFPQKDTLGVAHLAPDRHLRVADPVHEEISLLSVYKVVLYTVPLPHMIVMVLPSAVVGQCSPHTASVSI